MPKNITLGGHFEQFVDSQVAGGHFGSAGEVVEAALSLLERERDSYQAKLAALQDAIDEGDASGIADDGVFDRVRERHGLPKTLR